MTWAAKRGLILVGWLCVGLMAGLTGAIVVTLDMSRSRHLRAVILDCDGTLVDTERLAGAVWARRQATASSLPPDSPFCTTDTRPSVRSSPSRGDS